MAKPKVTEEFQAYIDKAETPTDTFKEYKAYLEKNTGLEFDQTQVVLVMRLYGKFQAENREAGGPRTRTAKGTAAPKPTETKPAKSTKAVPAKPAVKAKPASKSTAPAAGKPAPKSGRRGAVAKPAEAPY